MLLSFWEKIYATKLNTIYFNSRSIIQIEKTKYQCNQHDKKSSRIPKIVLERQSKIS